ncbi:hypothetical protein EDD22DRAFT_1054196 [Suillus occidentalis]|nr:hypothetical protein EDD22DRAFT_1054196 [Suillus occidentalis]
MRRSDESNYRANAQKYNQALQVGENKGKKSNGVSSYDVLNIQMLAGHSWRICALEDSRGRCSALLNTSTINPRRGNPNSRDIDGSRVYQIMLQHVPLLPCTKYTQPVSVDSFKDSLGKREAVDEVV